MSENISIIISTNSIVATAINQCGTASPQLAPKALLVLKHASIIAKTVNQDAKRLASSSPNERKTRVLCICIIQSQYVGDQSSTIFFWDQGLLG